MVLVGLSVLLCVLGPADARAATNSGCAAVQAAETHSVREVLYATTRQVAASTRFGPQYGSRRESRVRYGTARVTVPGRHTPGCLESPGELFGLPILPDIDKHVLLRSARESANAEFFRQVAALVARSPRSEVLVFVHGYNVSFEDAVRRGAQLQHDLNFGGVIIVFSWPSRGQPLEYMSDRTAAGASAHHFEGFLRTLRLQSGATAVHVLAHSMGNEVVTRALEHFGQRREVVVQEVVFTAPDVDQEEFVQRLPSMGVAARRLTLYASANDLALKFSQGFARYPRAGQAGRSLVVHQGLETVDASSMQLDFLGHSYFVAKPVLSDLERIVVGRTPRQRGLRQTAGYWRFPQD